MPEKLLLRGSLHSRLESKGQSYLRRNFDAIVEKDEEGSYVASVPALPGCHTQAKSLDELDARIRAAVELCLEVDGLPKYDLEFAGIQRVVIGMSQSPRVTGADLIAALGRAGFAVARVRGSTIFSGTRMAGARWCRYTLERQC